MKKTCFKFGFLILSLSLIFSCSSPQKKDVKVFFYHLELQHINAIKTLLSNKFSNDNINLIFEELKDKDHIKNIAQEEGYSIIFSKKRELPFSTSILQRFSDEVYDKLSFNIRRYGKTNFPKRYVFSLPLLKEPYYLVVKKGMDIKYFDISMNTSIYDKNKFERECKNCYPIMVSGGDDETLFLFLLFCMQSIKDTKEERRGKMTKGENEDVRMSLEDKIEMLNIIHKPKALHDSLKNLLTLQKAGAFHPEWFRLKKEDVSLFLELSEAGMAFLSRSEYQKMLKEKNFSYSLIDSSLVSSPYPLPTSIIYLFKIEKNVYEDGKMTPTKMIEEYLMSDEGQKELGDATSLLPSTFNDENIKDIDDILIIEDESSMKEGAYTKIEKIGDLPSLLEDVRQYFYVCGTGY